MSLSYGAWCRQFSLVDNEATRPSSRNNREKEVKRPEGVSNRACKFSARETLKWRAEAAIKINKSSIAQYLLINRAGFLRSRRQIDVGLLVTVSSRLVYGGVA